MCQALRHYQHAIAALQGETYGGISDALRSRLLQRLGQERDALLERIA
jgi:hypothetical protein